MLGAIIGDIAGSRFEFNNYLNTDFKLFTKECAYTDDTICTIAVAYSLLSKGKISFSDSLLYWCRKYPNPKGHYGGSFAKWIHSNNNEPYNSFGNGSAMRVSPCAWLSNDLDTILQYAKQSAECTHNHPEGIKGAMCIAECIYHAKNGVSKEQIKDIITSKYGYNLNTNCDKIRATNTFNETCQVTVPQAIVAFIDSTDFESAISLAVSIGGDSDTIAAITGSIAEAYYSIPENIKEKALEYLPNELKEVINLFYKTLDE